MTRALWFKDIFVPPPSWRLLQLISSKLHSDYWFEHIPFSACAFLTYTRSLDVNVTARSLWQTVKQKARMQDSDKSLNNRKVGLPNVVKYLSYNLSGICHCCYLCMVTVGGRFVLVKMLPIYICISLFSGFNVTHVKIIHALSKIY